MRSPQYTANYKRGQDNITHQVNYTGNHIKSLHLSVHDSLKRLRTSYIDILVLQGKVLYLVYLLPYAILDLPF